jgi:hypothetical protein
MEIFRISIQVTSTSIYQHEQGLGIIKESIQADSIFNNDFGVVQKLCKAKRGGKGLVLYDARAAQRVEYKGVAQGREVDQKSSTFRLCNLRMAPLDLPVHQLPPQPQNRRM